MHNSQVVLKIKRQKIVNIMNDTLFANSHQRTFWSSILFCCPSFLTSFVQNTWYKYLLAFILKRNTLSTPDYNNGSNRRKLCLTFCLKVTELA